MRPPSPNSLELQRKLSAEFQQIEVKLAVVVSERRLVHLAKLAFGDLNYRVFCESVNDALQWLQWPPLNAEPPKRVLIADVPAAIPILTRALGQDYHLLPRTSWAGACAAVQDGIDVVLCGIGFEESMMFDLLVYLRNQEATRTTPFFCIKCIGQKLPSTLNDGIEIALHAKGPGGYVDFEAWQLSVGEHRASISLREKVSESLSAQAWSHLH